MTEQRHCDSCHGFPSRGRSYERDPGIRGSGRYSPSYLSLTAAWPEPDRSRMVPAREVPTSGGDVRSFHACESRNPEGGEYRQNRYFSGMNRINDPVHAGRSLFGLTGSVPRGEECMGQRRIMSMSGFSESVLGTREKSASRKFQWDKLLADDKTIIANPNRINYGGFCDSGAVPVSMSDENNSGGSSISCYNQRMEASESGRNYGVIDRRYASPKGRTSILDSIVEKIEGDKNIHVRIDDENTFRDNMMNKRRGMLLENDKSFAKNEKLVECRSLNVNPAENQTLTEDFCFQRNNHGFSVCEVVDRMPFLYKEYDSPGNSCHQVMSLEEALELGLEPNSIDNQKILGLRLKGNHNDNQKLVLPYEWNAFEDARDSTSGAHRNLTAEEIEQLAMFEDSRQVLYQGRSTGCAIDAMAIDGSSFYSADLLSMPSHSSKPSKPFKRDVRQRLGPVLSIKQRLGHPPQKRQRTSTNKKKCPWVKRVHERTMECLEQKISVQEVKFPEATRKKHSKTEPKKYAKTEPEEHAKTEPEEYAIAKAEPPEDSEQFKNQVQKAFLKLYKILNENSADRRMYLEQGRVGRLKCCVCGSSSKEFVDTLGLAQHAFFSCKSRSEHMGLYKAICVLLGWNSTNFVNGVWIRQILPFAEASSLREDLIIWPPVVLIHNRSIANDNKDKHMTLSIEGLKHILRGMGCEGMIIIRHGKAACQGSMVVSFSGTYSGLCEAEKLHKLFSKKQRGRAEFEQVSSYGRKRNHQETRTALVDSKTNHQMTQNTLADDRMNHQKTRDVQVVDRMNLQETPNILVDDRTNHQDTENLQVVDNESFLYGYMGIASDLDVLDSNTKRRCVVKSKRDIEATADASFKPQ